MSLPLGRRLNGEELQLVITRQGFIVHGVVEGKTDTLASIQVTTPKREGDLLFINGFYVHVTMDPSGFTDEEKAAAKGLGKLMLCALMKHLNLGADTPVELDASGGTVPPGHVHTESEEEVDAFLAKYPDVLEDLKHDAPLYGRKKPSLRMKQDAYRSILENRKLVDYYRRYGFEVVEGRDMGMYTHMSSTVGQIMAACGKAGGRRKTRRRGKKSRRRR